MSTKVSLGTVDITELRRLFDTLLMLRMESKNVTAVTVYCTGGKRRWLIATDELSIVITGDTARFEGAYRLPLTIVANAGRHGASGGDVTFTVTDNMVSAESSLGVQTLPCSQIPIPTPHRSPVTRSRVWAQLGGKELTHVVFSGANPPFEAGLADDDEQSKNPDHFLIAIEDGRLSVSSDWSTAKLYLMRATSTAETHGAGQVKVDPDFLSVIFNCVDHDSTWKLSFDPKQPHEIVLESDTQYIVAEMTMTPSVKLHERLVKVLEREQFEFDTAADGSIGVRHEGVVVSVHVFDRAGEDTPMVRLTTVIARDANESTDLLREINDHNKSGAVTRLWFADNAVHSAIDLLADNLSVFSSRIRHLVGEAQRLSGILEPFAAEPAISTPRRKRRRSVRTEPLPQVWD